MAEYVPKIGADPMSRGPAVTADVIAQAWDRLKDRAGKLSAPPEALQDFYKAYAKIMVSISSGRPVAELFKIASWTAYDKKFFELEQQYPQKTSFWKWALGGAAVLGGYYYWRRAR